MVFSSQIFLFLFLPIAFAVYFLTPRKWRNFVLLLLSFVFYAWASQKLLFVLLFSIAINFVFGILIQRLRNKRTKLFSAVIITGITANLAMLGYFKYLNFFIDNVNKLSSANISIHQIALPLGISFFTFSGISYLLDIYAEKINASNNLINFALYMAFFPKLIQGPIARYDEMTEQIIGRNTSSEKTVEGITRFVVGLAKKVIIADQLGLIIDPIFSTPAIQNSMFTAWLGAIGYTFQIYFDFSGYTDMAIGLGKIFGFELPENFNFPYLSTSFTEFWRRWHITLGAWFREYIFYPLEFRRRRVKHFRQGTNTLIVFFLTGLWHGANWNFILWGTLNGLIISVEGLFSPRKEKNKVILFVKWLCTFLLLIIGWVLFRSPDIQYTGQYLGIMFGLIKSAGANLPVSWIINAKTISLLIACTILCVPWKNLFANCFKKFEQSKGQIIFRFVATLFLLVLSLLYVVSSSYTSFIYFKF